MEHPSQATSADRARWHEEIAQLEDYLANTKDPAADPAALHIGIACRQAWLHGEKMGVPVSVQEN